MKTGGVCVYCVQPAETDDHVPPKDLFASPRPSRLLTVPSCFASNGGSSLDDEHFRNILAFRHDVLGQPDARRLSEMQGAAEDIRQEIDIIKNRLKAIESIAGIKKRAFSRVKKRAFSRVAPLSMKDDRSRSRDA